MMTDFSPVLRDALAKLASTPRRPGTFAPRTAVEAVLGRLVKPPELEHASLEFLDTALASDVLNDTPQQRLELGPDQQTHFGVHPGVQKAALQGFDPLRGDVGNLVARPIKVLGKVPEQQRLQQVLSHIDAGEQGAIGVERFGHRPTLGQNRLASQTALQARRSS